MDKKTCLEEAAKCITKDRQNSYGNPENNFATIAEYWQTHLDARAKMFGYDKLNTKIRPEDVAIMMCHLKLSRMISSPKKADNYIDGAGYLAIASELTASE